MLDINKFYAATFLLLTILISPIGNSFAEIIYNDREELLMDQVRLSDSDLGQERSTRSIYLMALRKIGNRKEEAKKELYFLKEKGVLDAEYSLFAFKDEFSIPQSIALEFLEDAAQKDHAISQEEIASLYQKGIYFPKEPSMAQMWMEKSAILGNSYAMKKTAKNYFMGYGKDRNDAKGYEWLQKLYNKAGRYFSDWRLLGKVHETGRGTPVDLVKAYMCYDLEGTAGIEEKARIASQMTAEQRAEGLRLSREWQEKNHVYTMQSLGLTRQQDGSYR